MEELFEYLIKWAGENGYQIVIENTDSDKEIDFININNKTKKIYFGDLDISEELTK